MKQTLRLLGDYLPAGDAPPLLHKRSSDAEGDELMDRTTSSA
jgi:hypothetical protein